MSFVSSAKESDAMYMNIADILSVANRNGFAVIACSPVDMEMCRAMVRAAEKMDAPIIFLLGQNMMRKIASAELVVPMIRTMAGSAHVPIAACLDHGNDEERIMYSIRNGFSSIMFDGSLYPLDENIARTRDIVRICHSLGMAVEGEIGHVGVAADGDNANVSYYTDPDEACRFVSATGVDALAISYGTMHGATKGRDVRLRKEIAIAIKELMRHEGIDGFLVSHGSSTVPAYIVEEINSLGGRIENAHGIPLEELKAVSHMGIAKINVDTDIRLAVTRNAYRLFTDHPDLREDEHLRPVWELMAANPSAFDPRVYLAAIMDTVMYNTIPSASVQRFVDTVKDGVMEGIGRLLVEFGQIGKARFVEARTLDQMREWYRKEGR